MSITIVAEVGINHNGSILEALKLCEMAKFAGADVVKFQTRTPELCVPKAEWDKPKLTPWGETLPYIEYRRRMEFSDEAYNQIAAKCEALGVKWTVSVWDIPSLRRALKHWHLPFVKIPSALMTNHALLTQAAHHAPHVVVSTGMSTWDEVLAAAAVLHREAVQGVTLMHCHSAYPCPSSEINLRMIPRLAGLGFDVGYSGHEYGLAPTVSSVHYGVTMIERHITMDTQAQGSDHSASLEPDVFFKLVKHIRSAEGTKGTGTKRVWPSEQPAREKLRK